MRPGSAAWFQHLTLFKTISKNTAGHIGREGSGKIALCNVGREV